MRTDGSAAERASAMHSGVPPVAAGPHQDYAMQNDYRIRFAQHDTSTLLQQRAHETFKSLGGGGTSASATTGAHSFVHSFGAASGARTDLMSTAARTPRVRIHAALAETHGSGAKVFDEC